MKIHLLAFASLLLLASCSSLSNSKVTKKDFKKDIELATTEGTIVLRLYDGITPGYHMNKQQWNSVSTTGNVPDRLILELADHSYTLIFGSLTKKLQAEIRP